MGQTLPAQAILIVSDEAFIRYDLVKLFEGRGFRCSNPNRLTGLSISESNALDPMPSHRTGENRYLSDEGREQPVTTP